MFQNFIVKILIFGGILLIYSCSSSFSNKDSLISIKGSETGQALIIELIDCYKTKFDSSIIFDVSGGGSQEGISSLQNESIDIAISSRKIKKGEKLIFENHKKKIVEIPLAKDALIMIVNNHNMIKNMTVQQINDIYKGKITNWSQLGGEDLEIFACSRSFGSGTYDFFKQNVLSNSEPDTNVFLMPDAQSVFNFVESNRNAIGYLGSSNLDQTINVLSIFNPANNQFVYPSVENIKSNKYPITRTLYVYYVDKNQSKIVEFTTFLNSKYIKPVINKVGLVSLNDIY